MPNPAPNLRPIAEKAPIISSAVPSYKPLIIPNEQPACSILKESTAAKYSPKYLKCSFRSAATLAAVGGLSKIWIDWFNKAQVVNLDHLESHIKAKKPLITVSNHTACADDPLLWGMLSWEILVVKPYLMRWTMAAQEICFTNRFTSRFFTLGRCIPTIRGQGVYQKSVDTCLDVLHNNGWVHIFPEGKVNLMKQHMRLKWGVGRLIAESTGVPTVIPMWHVGMDEILPNIKPRIPRIGKMLTILIGDPISFEQMLADFRKDKLTATEIRIKITQKIQQAFDALKIDAENLHNKFTNHARLK